jgi:hypothetical protein
MPSNFEDDWNDLVTFLNTWYYKPDIEGLRIILCTYLSHFYYSSPPVWLSVIGLPGSGKTEVGIKPFQQLADVHTISELTTNSFLSGFGEGNGVLDKLTQISKGDKRKHGILLFPDFTTTLLSKDQFTRAEIMGQMRRVYDGNLEKKVGNKDKMLTWEGKVTCIAAATPDIEEHWAVHRDMGERWLSLKWLGIEDTFENRKMVSKYARRQDGNEDTIKKEFNRRIIHLLENISGGPDKPIDSDELDAIGILLEEMRVNVKREFTGRGYAVTGLGNKQYSTRTPKCLASITKASCALRRSKEISEIDIHLAKRIAMDSIPHKRFKVIEVLMSIYPNSLSKIDLAKATGNTRNTFERILEDMRHMKLLEVAQDKEDAAEGTDQLELEENAKGKTEIWEENPYQFTKVKKDWNIRLHRNLVTILKEAKLMV